ncbi:Uncharacterised protein [Streptococcus pneumoniae]|nr:Uncharacterised protein [Streptococcus pneumoniae]
MRIYLHEPLITTVSQDFTSLSDISATHFEQLHIMTIVHSDIQRNNSPLTCDNRLSLHSVAFFLPESFANSFFRAIDFYFRRINHYRVLRAERSS